MLDLADDVRRAPTPGLNTVTLPPVTGKISAPSVSFAVPTVPGVSLSVVECVDEALVEGDLGVIVLSASRWRRPAWVLPWRLPGRSIRSRRCYRTRRRRGRSRLPAQWLPWSCGLLLEKKVVM